MSARTLFPTTRVLFLISILLGGITSKSNRTSWELKTIEQTSPVASAENTISILLSCKYEIFVDDIISLGNLRGLALSGLIQLDGNASDYLQAIGYGQTLNLSVLQNISAMSRLSASFEITNPAADQPGPVIEILVTDSFGTLRLFAENMTQDTSEILGLKDGGRALYIVVPKFLTKSIGQSNPFVSSNNTISVILIPNLLLQVNSSILIWGLEGINLNGTIQLQDANELLARFRDQNGVISILLSVLEQVEAAQAVNFSFSFTNPAQTQGESSVSISASTPSFQIQSEPMTVPSPSAYGVTQGSSPGVVVVPIFTTRSIGQSNPLISGLNTISATMQANCDLAALSRLQLSGLSGFQTRSGAIQVSVVSLVSGNAVANTATWNQTNGTIVITTSQGLQSTDAYTASFQLQNGVVAQTAVTVTISALVRVDAYFVPAPPADMYPPDQSLLGINNGSNPRQTFAPAFVLRNIGQSAPFVSVSNTVGLTLQCNCDLPTSSQITVSGLVRTQTTGSNISILSNASSVFGKTALWNQSAGRLTLVLSQSMFQSVAYFLTFKLTNAAVDQPASPILVSGTVKISTVNTPIASVSAILPNQNLFGVKNGSNPPVAVTPGFDVAIIGQSNPLLFASTTITVTLQPNCNLASTSSATILGLVGSISNDGEVDIASNGVFATPSYWITESGMITLTWSTSTASGISYQASFDLQNSATPQPNPIVSISANFLVSAANVTYTFSVATTALSVPNTECEGVIDGCNPLFAISPAFNTKQIGQSNPLTSASNNITATLIANCDMHERTTVTITGLIGSQLQGSSVLLKSPSVFERTASWASSTGTLILTIATNKTLYSNTSYSFTFEVQNRATPQPSPTISIAAFIPAGDFNSPMFYDFMTVSNQDALGVPLGADVLLTVYPTIVRKSIGQGNPFTYASNLITVTIQSGCDIAAASMITIWGLTGSLTSSAALELDPTSNSNFASSALWGQVAGQLLVTVASGMSNTVSYIIAFQLRNSAVPQSSPPVSISATIAAGTFNSPLSAQSLTVTNQNLFGLVNGSNPLLTVVPLINIKEIGQSFPFASLSNNISVTLQTKYDMAPLSIISIVGLTVSKTKSGALSLLSSSDAVFLSKSAWYQVNGTLAVTLSKTMLHLTMYSFMFELQNGANPESSPSVSISAVVQAGLFNSPVIATSMSYPNQDILGVANGSNPMEIVLPVFTVKTLSQSNPLALATNVIQLEFAVNCDLETDSTILLSGLTGMQTQTGNLPALLKYADIAMLETVLWNQTAGSVEFTVGQTIGRSQLYFLSFELENSAGARPSPAISILGVVRSRGFESPINGKPVSELNQALLGVPNGTDPLLTVVPFFRIQVMAQSNPLASASNNITVTLQANCDISYGSTIALDNLVGTLTGDTASLQVWSVPFGAFEPFASWERGAGRLVLTVAADSMLSTMAYEASFEVQNGLVPQKSPQVIIYGSVKTLNHSAPIYSSNVSVRNEMRLGVENGANPLEIILPEFLVQSIGQNNPLVNASNTLTATLQINCDLSPSSTITMTNLTGSQTNDNNSLSIHSNPAAFSSHGIWLQKEGILVVSVSESGTVQNTTYTLRFELQNSAVAHQPPSISVAGEIIAGLHNSFLAKKAFDVHNSSALGIPLGTSPLLTVEPRFNSGYIVQSVPFCSLRTLITVTLEPSCDLSPGTVITISNLLGSQTKDNETVPAASSPEGLLEARTSWFQDSGSLLLTMASDFYITPSCTQGFGPSGEPCADDAQSNTQSSILVLSFELQNSAVPQPSPSVSVSALISAGVHGAPIRSEAMALLNQTIFGVRLGGNPLYAIIPSFLVKSIGQSNPLASASTVITVTLQTNCDFSAGSRVILTNLIGSQTADDPSLPVSVNPSNAFESSGVWSSGSGSLELLVAGAGLLYNESYILAFVLQNSATTQSSPSVSIIGTVLAGTNDAPVLPEVLDSSQASLLGVTNGAGPLCSQVPYFLISSVNQTSPFPGLQNILTVRLKVSVDLRGSDGSALTILGLTSNQSNLSASLEPKLPVNNISQYPLPSAALLEEGSTIFPVLRDKIVYTHTEYQFSLEAINSLQAVPLSNIYILANGTAQFPRTLMLRNAQTFLGIPCFFCPPLVWVPQFVVNNIVQSQPICGITNILTISLSPNLDLESASSITISSTLLVGISFSGLFYPGSVDFLSNIPPRILNGELVVQVAPTYKLLAGSIYVFKVQIVNPQTQSAPPKLYSAASGSNMAEIKAVEMMYNPSTNQLGIQDASHPLFCVVPAFTMRSIAQHNPLASKTGLPQLNNISVQFRTNIDLTWDQGTVITITGLTNLLGFSTTVSVLEQPAASLFCSSYSGNAQTGAMLLSESTLTFGICSVDSLKANTNISFVFTVINPMNSQAGTQISISANQLSGPVSIVPALMATPNRELVGVPNGSNPGVICAPTFTVAMVSQTNPFVGLLNTITFLLQSNVTFLEGSVFTITGIRGNSASDQNTVELESILGAQADIHDCTSFLCESNGCLFSDGILVLPLLRRNQSSPFPGFQASVTYGFAFQLRNPLDPTNEPAKVQIQASGSAKIDPIMVQQPNILTLERPVIEHASALQANPLCDTPNTITVLISFTNTVSELKITIFGLAGLNMTNLINPFSPLAVSSNEAISVENQHLADGTLTIESFPCSFYAADTIYTTSFNVLNSVYPKQASNLEISASGVLQLNEPQVNLSECATAQGQIFQFSAVVPTVTDEEVLGVPGGSIPLRTIELLFTYATILQTVPIAGARNTITMLLEMNFNPQPFNSNTATLSGLSTALSPSISMVRGSSLCCVATGHCSNTSVDFSIAQGLISFDLSGIGTAAACSFEFSFLNAFHGRLASEIFIEAKYVRKALMLSPSSTVLGVVNGSKPGLLITPKFISLYLEQSNPLANAVNIITASVALNVDLIPGSELNLSGIAALLPYPDPNKIMAAARQPERLQNFSAARINGIWVLQMNNSTLNANEIHVFQWVVMNPSSPQASPQIFMSAFMPAIAVEIPYTEMTTGNESRWGVSLGARPLYIVQPEFRVKAVGQTNPIASSSNSIWLSLALNVDVYSGSEFTIHGVDPAVIANYPTISDIRASAASSLLPPITCLVNQSGYFVFKIVNFWFANQSCSTVFKFRNAAAPNMLPRKLSISGSIADAVPIPVASTSLDEDAKAVLGVANGSTPFLVLSPSFRALALAASHLSTSGLNVIALTLVPDCDVTAPCNITITTLEPLSSTLDVLFDKSELDVIDYESTYEIGALSWTRSRLVLTLLSGALQAQVVHRIFIRARGLLNWVQSGVLLSATVRFPASDFDVGFEDIFMPLSTSPLVQQCTFRLYSSFLKVAESPETLRFDGFAFNLLSGFGESVVSAIFNLTLVNQSCATKFQALLEINVLNNGTLELLPGFSSLTAFGCADTFELSYFFEITMSLTDGSVTSEPHFFEITVLGKLPPPFVQAMLVGPDAVEISWQYPTNLARYITIPAVFEVSLIMLYGFPGTAIVVNTTTAKDPSTQGCAACASGCYWTRRLVFTGLTAGWWSGSVRAVSSALSEGLAGVSEYVQLFYLPSFPPSFTATQISADEIVLTWRNPDDIGDGTGDPSALLGFEVLLRDELGEVIDTIYSATWNTHLTYSLDSLAPGTILNFSIRAFNPAGEGAFSSPLILVSRLPPDPVQDLSATEIENGLLLRWSPPANNGLGFPDQDGSITMTFAVTLSNCSQPVCAETPICRTPTFTCGSNATLLVESELLPTGRLLFIRVYTICTKNGVGFTSNAALISAWFRLPGCRVLNPTPINIVLSHFPCRDAEDVQDYNKISACTISSDCVYCSPQHWVDLFVDCPIMPPIDASNLKAAITSNETIPLGIQSADMIGNYDHISDNNSNWYPRKTLKLTLGNFPNNFSTGPAQICIFNESFRLFCLDAAYVEASYPSVLSVLPDEASVRQDPPPWIRISLLDWISGVSWTQLSGLWVDTLAKGWPDFVYSTDHNITVSFGGVSSDNVVVSVDDQGNSQRKLSIYASLPFLGIKGLKQQLTIDIAMVTDKGKISIAEYHNFTLWKGIHIHSLLPAIVQLFDDGTVSDNFTVILMFDHSIPHILPIALLDTKPIPLIIIESRERQMMSIQLSTGSINFTDTRMSQAYSCPDSYSSTCFEWTLNISFGDDLFVCSSVAVVRTRASVYPIRTENINITGEELFELADIEEGVGIKFFALTGVRYCFSVNLFMGVNCGLICPTLAYLAPLENIESESSNVSSTAQLTQNGDFVNVVFSVETTQAMTASIMIKVTCDYSSPCRGNTFQFCTQKDIVQFHPSRTPQVVGMYPSVGPADSEFLVMMAIFNFDASASSRLNFNSQAFPVLEMEVIPTQSFLDGWFPPWIVPDKYLPFSVAYLSQYVRFAYFVTNGVSNSSAFLLIKTACPAKMFEGGLDNFVSEMNVSIDNQTFGYPFQCNRSKPADAVSIVSCFPTSASIQGGTPVSVTLSNAPYLQLGANLSVFLDSTQIPVEEILFSNPLSSRFVIAVPAGRSYKAMTLTVSSEFWNVSMPQAIEYIPEWNPRILMLAPDVLMAGCENFVTVAGDGFPDDDTDWKEIMAWTIPPSGRAIFASGIEISRPHSKQLFVNFSVNVSTNDVDQSSQGLISLLFHGVYASTVVSFSALNPSDSKVGLTLNDPCCILVNCEDGAAQQSHDFGEICLCADGAVLIISGILIQFSVDGSNLMGSLGSSANEKTKLIDEISLAKMDTGKIEFYVTCVVRGENISVLLQLLAIVDTIKLWTDSVEVARNAFRFCPFTIVDVYPVSEVSRFSMLFQVMVSGPVNLLRMNETLQVDPSEPEKRISAWVSDISSTNMTALVLIDCATADNQIHSSATVTLSSDSVGILGNVTLQLNRPEAVQIEVIGFSGSCDDDGNTLIGSILGGDTLVLLVQGEEVNSWIQSSIYFRFGGNLVLADIEWGSDSSNPSLLATVLTPSADSPPGQVNISMLTFVGTFGTNITFFYGQPISTVISAISPGIVNAYYSSSVSVGIQFSPVLRNSTSVRVFLGKKSSRTSLNKWYTLVEVSIVDIDGGYECTETSCSYFIYIKIPPGIAPGMCFCFY